MKFSDLSATVQQREREKQKAPGKSREARLVKFLINCKKLDFLNFLSEKYAPRIMNYSLATHRGKRKKSLEPTTERGNKLSEPAKSVKEVQ